MSFRSILGKSFILVIIAASALSLVAVISSREPDVREKPVLPVETVRARKGELEKTVRVSGFIESDTMITLLPRIGGTLDEVYLEMGDAVEKDQVVALIDSEPYTLSYNQAKAAFLAAESTFRRIEALYTTKSVSQQNYDEARANYDALKASYELAELNLSYTELKSPVKGVILEKHVSKGAMVAPQIPVVTIGDLSELKVSCGIPEIHYSHFVQSAGSMEVSVTVPAMGNRVFRGGISRIAPYISSESRNFKILCRIDDDDQSLRPGMFAYVDFVLEKREAVYSLPYDVLAGGRLWYADEDASARSVSFESFFGNEDFFQIPDELADKEFIIKGQHFLDEGQKIRIIGASE